MSLHTSFDLAGAVDRLALYFATSGSRPALLARRALGQPAADDAALTARLVEAMRGELRPDGSVGGAVVPTIWRAHELMDLGHGGDQPGTVRAIRWVLSLQGKPGGFSDGCSPERHGHRVCEHFIGGFFSPGPATQRLAPITFPNGKVFRAEPAARFVLSCLALRAVLRAGGNVDRHPLVELHLASLSRLATLWTEWGGYFAPDLIVAGLHALALAPEPHRTPIPSLVALVAAHQRPDGEWPNADFFHVLEALLAVDSPDARTVVRRALPGLTARQRPDGTFGTAAQQERGLIGLRALLGG